MTEKPLTRMQAFEGSHDIGSNPSRNFTFEDISAMRFGRRDLLSLLFKTVAHGPPPRAKVVSSLPRTAADPAIASQEVHHLFRRDIL